MNKMLKELQDNNVAVLKVKNKAMLNMIQAKHKGELCYCEDTDSFFICDGETWRDYDTEVKAKNAGKGIQYSLYELNQDIMENMDFLTEQELDENVQMIVDWVWDYYADEAYFMLLGKNNDYYTIFKRSTIHECENLGEGVKECLIENGINIYSIEDVDDHSSIEIWVKFPNYDKPTVMYLFPYSLGIVTIGG